MAAEDDGLRVEEPPLSSPTPRLALIAVVLVAGGIGAAFLWPRLAAAFAASPVLNGAILTVFAIGVLYVVHQMWSLRREIAWIEAFNDGAHGAPEPRLLSAMAAMLGKSFGKPRFALSPGAQRAIIDGVAARLEERREVARYLIGLLVFLGLLGTFWGLLDVVAAVAGVISALDLSGDADGFVKLREGLSAPIAGMGVAFSSSLFGLAGSLALGFLELQAGQAQNRFFGELETWASRRTRLAAGGGADEGEAPGLSYVAALLEQTADSIQSFERTARKGEENAAELRRALARIAETLAASDADAQTRMADDLAAMRAALEAMAERAEATPALLRAMDERLAVSAEQAADGRARAAEALSREIKLLARTLGGERGG